MKKYILSLSIAFIAVTAFGQDSIPNGSFEKWDSASYDYPQYYLYNSNIQSYFKYQTPFNEVMTTDHYHGAYALQLMTVASSADTVVGFFSNANPVNTNPHTWSGGIPYNQKPKGIRGYYKYNVVSGDSALIFVAFSRNGSNVGTYIFKVGGVHNSYTLFNFTFNPQLTIAPDSVNFGAASSNELSHIKMTGSTLELDSVSFTGVSAQPAMMKGDFESWQSQMLYKPADWSFKNDDGSGLFKTTDKVVGKLAVELKTVKGTLKNHPIAKPTQIFNGYFDNTCSCYKGGFPFSNQIDTLAFWYKYIPADPTDSAWINYLYKKNGASIFGNIKYLHSSPNYQYVEIPFHLSQAPDSAVIQVQSSAFGDTLPAFIGADLKIDDMHFKTKAKSSGIFEFENAKTINIFPNPTKSNFTIINPNKTSQDYILSLQNMQGQEVLHDKINLNYSYVIDVSNLQDGVYILTMQNEKDNYISRIVVQR